MFKKSYSYICLFSALITAGYAQANNYSHKSNVVVKNILNEMSSKFTRHNTITYALPLSLTNKTIYTYLSQGNQIWVIGNKSNGQYSTLSQYSPIYHSSKVFFSSRKKLSNVKSLQIVTIKDKKITHKLSSPLLISSMAGISKNLSQVPVNKISLIAPTDSGNKTITSLYTNGKQGYPIYLTDNGNDKSKPFDGGLTNVSLSISDPLQNKTYNFMFPHNPQGYTSCEYPFIPNPQFPNDPTKDFFDKNISICFISQNNYILGIVNKNTQTSGAEITKQLSNQLLNKLNSNANHNVFWIYLNNANLSNKKLTVQASYNDNKLKSNTLSFNALAPYQYTPNDILISLHHEVTPKYPASFPFTIPNFEYDYIHLFSQPIELLTQGIGSIDMQINGFNSNNKSCPISYSHLSQNPNYHKDQRVFVIGSSIEKLANDNAANIFMRYYANQDVFIKCDQRTTRLPSGDYDPTHCLFNPYIDDRDYSYNYDLIYNLSLSGYDSFGNYFNNINVSGGYKATFTMNDLDYFSNLIYIKLHIS